MIELFNKETKKFEEQPKRHSVIFVDKNYIASEEEKDGKTTIVYFDTKLETIVKATVNSDNVKRIEGEKDEKKREAFEMLVQICYKLMQITCSTRTSSMRRGYRW